MTLQVESERRITDEEGRKVDELVVNVGPSHPSTHGVCRIIAHLDGEVVVNAKPVIGYLHRGIEKMAENRTYLQVVPLTDRLDYVGSMYANWAYCRSLERLAGIRVPERAEYIRTIVCELQRIASHMMAMGGSGADTGAFTAFVWAFEVREYVIDLFDELAGSRLTYNYVRPGGVAADLPDGWVEKVREAVRIMPVRLRAIDDLFFGNWIAGERLRGIGVLSESEAIAWGATGPTARGSGVQWDIRKNDPYSVYPRLDFKVPVGENGDCFDRSRIKLLESIESCRIVEQALDQIEPGPVMTDGLPRLLRPRAGDSYDHIESARGSLGVYLVSDGSPRPYRMKVRSPAFCNLQLIEKLAPGHTISDLVVILGSLDPVFGEVDPVTTVLWGAVAGLGCGIAIALGALFGVWWERKVAARIQMRFGPQQAGPAGLLQTLADTVKLVLKEDITPKQVDVRIFRMAPLLVFVPTAIAMVTIPLFTGWAPLDTSTGILLFLAVPSISVLGVLIGGWSSGNTYATIGGLRGAAQMVSYEIPRTLSVLSLVVVAGTMRPAAVMAAWRWWWIPLFAVAFVVYMVSSIAEMNRGPFDLPEADSELVAGYFADYSGIRWAIFMMTEYGAVLGCSFFGAAVFLGGTNGLPGAAGALLLLLKAIALITVIGWIKWTLPRFRQDQLMRLAWKVLTPISLVQLLVAGAVAVLWLR